MQHNLITPEKSKLKTSYKITDQYSLKMSGHKRQKKKKKNLTSYHRLEDTKNKLKPHALWHLKLDPRTQKGH